MNALTIHMCCSHPECTNHAACYEASRSAGIWDPPDMFYNYLYLAVSSMHHEADKPDDMSRLSNGMLWKV